MNTKHVLIDYELMAVVGIMGRLFIGCSSNKATTIRLKLTRKLGTMFLPILFRK